MLLGHQLADIPNNGCDIARLWSRLGTRQGEVDATAGLTVDATLDLLHHHQTFFAIHFYSKSSTTMGAQSRMTLFDRGFNILRVMGAGADDHDVFEAAGDKKLVLMHETEITGA
jgi:hypothetical protein